MWKSAVPSKPLIGKLAHSAGLKPGHAKSLYIKAARLADRDPFADIDMIFKRFVAV